MCIRDSYQDVGATDPTSIFFGVTTDGTNLTFTFQDTNIDEGSDWYTANFGQSFTETAILNNQFPLWGGVPNPVIGNQFVVPIGSTFFLAANTGVGFEPSGLAPNRQHFGWVELQANSTTDLLLLDNAVAYSDGGILIGQNVAPEPDGGLLIGFAALGLLLQRRRRSVA